MICDVWVKYKIGSCTYQDPRTQPGHVLCSLWFMQPLCTNGTQREELNSLLKMRNPLSGTTWLHKCPHHMCLGLKMRIPESGPSRWASLTKTHVKLFLLPSLPVWAIPITWIELWTEYYVSLFSEGKIKQLHKIRIRMLAPWVSPENSQWKYYQLIYYTKWECPKKFRTVLMWQPAFDGALSWLLFHLCCQKNCYNKKLCSTREMNLCPLCHNGPSPSPRKSCHFYDRRGLGRLWSHESK